MLRNALPYAILQHIVDKNVTANEDSLMKLPPMEDLAHDMRVSRGKLREELVVAQAYGVVEMRPGDGTYILPFDFYAAIRTAVLYGVALDRKNFDRFYKLRVQLEVAFWDEAVRNLGPEEHKELDAVLAQAQHKLAGPQAELPHTEHRRFHLLIFSKLQNEFVQGLLEAYWDAYEAVGLNLYFDYSYYETMWSKHRAIADAIKTERYEEGKNILIKHFTLLDTRLQRSDQAQRAGD
jgi:DNA-binding FadR family transcriptional regulator